MAEYVKPTKGGAHCPECGQLSAAYRVMPTESGCRVRYHRCMVCDQLFKSVERVEEEERGGAPVATL